VVLRNLSLDGANGGRIGVDYNSASSLVVEDCVVANFANHGIERLANSPDLAQLTVSDTTEGSMPMRIGRSGPSCPGTGRTRGTATTRSRVARSGIRELNNLASAYSYVATQDRSSTTPLDLPPTRH
jgi:hypothetical protein